MKTIAMAIAVLPLTLLGINNAAANLVSNPSFEAFTGSFGGDGGSALFPSSTTLTGWSITADHIAVLELPNIYGLTPSDGNNFLDLTGYNSLGFPKGVSQTLNGLTVGQTYTFAMDLGIANPIQAGTVCARCRGPIQVAASIGSTGQTFTHNSADPGNVWGTYGFNFTADSPNPTLTINGISVPPFQIYIGLDNVSVNAVPLPAAVWLLGTGLLPLFGALKKRQ